ncbi:MAG: hypothetical protein AAF496_11525 [Pseudomonadota bacterium]
MKPLRVLCVLIACCGCADIPELEDSEPASVRSAPYPDLVPLQDRLGPPIDPISQALVVEEDLNARSEALAKKAQALQNAETN